MNWNEVKPPIYVCVRVREPLLHAGACAALQQEPDIVLVDYRAEGPPGKVDVLVIDGSAVRELPESYAASRVLVIAASARRHAIQCAFQRGINGVMLSSSGTEELVAGIRSVARGRTFLCQALAFQVANVAGNNVLTTREDDVLQLLAQGLCNKSIGRQLDIATETVKFHVKSIMVKLDASSRTEAASIAISKGMTEHFALSLQKRKSTY